MQSITEQPRKLLIPTVRPRTRNRLPFLPTTRIIDTRLPQINRRYAEFLPDFDCRISVLLRPSGQSLDNILSLFRVGCLGRVLADRWRRYQHEFWVVGLQDIVLDDFLEVRPVLGEGDVLGLSRDYGVVGAEEDGL